MFEKFELVDVRDPDRKIIILVDKDDVRKFMDMAYGNVGFSVFPRGSVVWK